MRSRIIGLLGQIHLRFFGHPMSEQMVFFLSNLSWSFAAGVVVLGATVIISTIGGRLIGPYEYGQYNYILVITQFIILFAFWGLDTSAIKAIAKSTDNSNSEKQKIISSTFWFVFLVLVLVAVAGLFINSYHITVLGLSHQLVFATLIYSLALALKTVFDISVRGLERFKIQAIARTIEMTVCLIALGAVLYFSHERNYQMIVSVFVTGAFAASLYYFAHLRRYLTQFSSRVLKKLLSEGSFFMLATLLSTIFLSSDRFIIAKYLDYTTLGIYSAYYMSSFTLLAQAGQLFTNVFLPASAKQQDKNFVKKIDRIFKLGLIPLIIISLGLLLVALLVFGRSYTLRPDYLFLFALLSSVYFFQAVYNTVILDLPKSRYRQYLFISNSIHLIIIFYFIILIRSGKLSIDPILIGLIIDIIALIGLQRVLINKYFLRQPANPPLSKPVNESMYVQ